MRIYPPLAGAGIKVTRVAEDFSTFEVSMRLRWWNRNYVGTHFGGSLYSMCDPFFMLILLERLGPEFIVWDKAASIRFRRPGKGTVSARFHISDERVAEIRQEVLEEGVVEPTFRTEVLNQEGKVVAEVEKLLYVRLKKVRSKTVRQQESRRERSSDG
ncbi:MAG: DUF4442 domain-containing protein [Deltaproteobacteria bacterium]|nr:DUF4442 domain-containing protein [Deltaproteobacteria bacterium]